MAITTLSCSNCGGQVSLDDSETSGVCSHCDTKILVKDNIGYQTIINTTFVQTDTPPARNTKKIMAFIVSFILSFVIVGVGSYFLISYLLKDDEPQPTVVSLSDISILNRNDNVWWIETDIWGASILIDLKNNNKHYDAAIIITFEIQDGEGNVLKSVDKEITVKSQEIIQILISTTIDTVQRNNYRYYNTPVRIA